MRALVHTSSTAPNVELKFVLDFLAALRDSGQSPPEWASYVRGRMQQPTTTLQSDDGGRLNNVRQMTAKLSKGDKQLQTVVYIQDLITKGDSDLGSTDLVTHGIDAGDRPAIDQPLRRLPLHYSGMWR